MLKNITPDLFKVTEVELVYRNKTKAKDRLKVSSPENAHDILRAAWDDNKIQLVEQFKILLLDRNTDCLGVSHIATGTTTQCLADAKIIFATALKSRSGRIILAHNHPSGNLKASEADIRLTERLYQAGKLLDIEVTDHLILTAESYTSLATEGLMP